MKGNPINLDTASAGRPFPKLAEWYGELLPVYSLNPHGGTCYAERCRRKLLDAERRLLALLGIRDGSAEIIWTSGVTEALNLAATAFGGMDAMVDPGAHAAMSMPLLSSGRHFQIGKDGSLFTDGPCSAAALSHVNNETGIEQDLRMIRGEIGDGLLLVDAAQSFCRTRIPWEEARIDMLALSSRKIGGPASVGALVCRKGRTALKPLILGGGQQRGMRSGTLDVCGIEMFVRTAECRCDGMPELLERQRRLCAELRSCLAAFPRRHEIVCGDGDRHIFMLHLPGYEGAVVSRILAEDYGIIVAASSACSAEHGGGSTTMRAMGYSVREAKEAVRISFDDRTEVEDIQAFFDALSKALDHF